MSVTLVQCQQYDIALIYQELKRAFSQQNLISYIKLGSRIGIKMNLVAPMHPETAAVTHPAVLSALCRLIIEFGATPVIGDSPGGPYVSAYLSAAYHQSDVLSCETYGAEMNQDFSTSEVFYPNGKELRQFVCTDWLHKVDAIINVSKLKTHGMMGLSASVKNLFGTIPGTMKPEYHFRFPDQIRFANMLIDLNEYWKPCINICDGIVAMEGNGPTKGVPREVGIIGISTSPYELDLVMGKLIGLKIDDVPTMQLAYERGLAPKSAEDVSLTGNWDLDKLQVIDFVKSGSHSDLVFQDRGKLVSAFLQKVLTSVPGCVNGNCVGCAKCASICPAKAIIMVNKKPVIDRKLCIRCFCCQEFCPVGAMKVKRTWIAKLLAPDRK